MANTITKVQRQALRDRVWDLMQQDFPERAIIQNLGRQTISRERVRDAYAWNVRATHPKSTIRPRETD